ncbi:hypothetical protein [Nannocystis bainbridge]|uniref:Uncharacterized protein n=1 Tax=Nannocystis bainbridge TaxID=2995303 RepID=A0ABT5ECG6_9BACT|nr:hypothetical protein [Nannocystis bainbridge]MDC0722552.1 hypothetical protein [Nannocystis bainbridge]
MCFAGACEPAGGNSQGHSSQPPGDDTSSSGGTDPTEGATGSATKATADSIDPGTTGDEPSSTTSVTTTGVDETTDRPSTSDWPSSDSDTESDSGSFITSDTSDDSGSFIEPPEDACDGCGANQVCIVVDDIPQCTAKCDPLIKAFCGADNVCVPVEDQFACAPDASGNTGKVGDGCIYGNGCDPGNICLSGPYVAGCNGQACCSPFCDTDLADPCVQYQMQCVAWYEMGLAPAGLEDVGVCIIP